MAGGPAVIDRYDRSRNINFEIELSGLPLGDVVSQVQQLPAIRNLPAGVKVVEVGDAEVMGELFASFGLAMLTGVLCIYIVLVLLFKDFLHPFTILAALPLSLMRVLTNTAFTPAGTPNTAERSISVFAVVEYASPSQAVEVSGVDKNVTCRSPLTSVASPLAHRLRMSISPLIVSPLQCPAR
jgi:multidrug efflux pump subunit AcrB